MKKKILTLSTCIALLAISTQVFAQSVKKTTPFLVFQIVLSNNPDIKSTLASIMSAEANVLQSGFSINPKAAVGVENFGGIGNLSGFGGAEITFGIEQEIEIAGKRSYRRDVASYGLAMAQQEAVANILVVLANAYQSYAGFVVAQERLKLVKKRLDLADKIHEVVNKRVSAAAASDIQHTKVDIEQKAAAIEKAKAKEKLALARAQLERILSTSVDQIGSENDILSASFDLPKKNELIAALDSLPQAQVVKLKELQAQSNVDLANAYSIPNPTIGLGVRHFNNTGSKAFLASFSISLPLFDRNQGNIKKAQTERMRAKIKVRSAILSLKEAAEKVYEQMTQASIEVKSYQKDIIPSAQKAYKQALEGYNLGRFSFLELLDAQRTLYKMQEAYLDSLLKLHQAKAQVDFLMSTHKDLIQNTISLKKGSQK